MTRIAMCIPILAATILVGCATSSAPAKATLVQGARPNHTTQDDTIVRRRLLAMFPIGAPESGLPAYLEQQGFQVRRLTNVGSTGDQVYGQAKLRWGGPIAGRQVRISWRASKDGVLTEVGSLVQDVGLMGELSQF